jgi:hypothetical protein
MVPKPPMSLAYRRTTNLKLTGGRPNLTETDVQQFADKESVQAWLNSATIPRGFVSFSTECKE